MSVYCFQNSDLSGAQWDTNHCAESVTGLPVAGTLFQGHQVSRHTPSAMSAFSVSVMLKHFFVINIESCGERFSGHTAMPHCHPFFECFGIGLLVILLLKYIFEARECLYLNGETDLSYRQMHSTFTLQKHYQHNQVKYLISPSLLSQKISTIT